MPPDGTDKIPHILTLARPHIVWGSRGNWGRPTTTPGTKLVACDLKPHYQVLSDILIYRHGKVLYLSVKKVIKGLITNMYRVYLLQVGLFSCYSYHFLTLMLMSSLACSALSLAVSRST